jgi:hypothetical protein
MVTKSGELRTYYQRNWEEVLPKPLLNAVKYLEPKMETVTHVAGLAFPFVGLLYKPAGTAISFTSISLNALVTGFELYIESKWTKVHAWSVIKNGAELIGTLASLRLGLVVHTIMNLAENSYKLVTNFKTWSQSSLPVASNVLYLLTLVNFSTPVSYSVIGASLVFQIAWNLSKARNEFTSLMEPPKVEVGDNNALRAKKINVTAHLAMAFIYLREVMKVHEAAWPLWQKQNAS